MCKVPSQDKQAQTAVLISVSTINQASTYTGAEDVSCSEDSTSVLMHIQHILQTYEQHFWPVFLRNVSGNNCTESIKPYYTNQL